MSVQSTHAGGIAHQSSLASAAVPHDGPHDVAVSGHLGVRWRARMATGHHCGERVNILVALLGMGHHHSTQACCGMPGTGANLGIGGSELPSGSCTRHQQTKPAHVTLFLSWKQRVIIPMLHIVGMQ